jgi:hypothetical protein
LSAGLTRPIAFQIRSGRLKSYPPSSPFAPRKNATFAERNHAPRSLPATLGNRRCL